MANIRTVDYKGFDSASNGTGPKGWMMWSGSQDLSGSTYSGVGMELVGGSESYLRFDAAADGAELEIKARQFFIGTETTQYISGSDGDIEISSSIFHLDPSTNKLIIGADAVINSNLSVNNLFTPAGTNANTATAYIAQNGDAGFIGDGSGNYTVDFKPSGAKISGFEISASEIKSANDNLRLKSSGQITGSLVNFSGGEIGGFEISATEIKSSNTNLQLKSTGEITGSQVKFTGGNIAGWEIDSNLIKKEIATGRNVYLNTSPDDQSKNIQEGLIVYRADADVNDGEVKIVRVGGLSNTSTLHSASDYGLQVIKKVTNGNWENLLYIGASTQSISGWNLTADKIFNDGIHLSASYGVVAFSGSTPSSNLVELKYLADDNYGLIGKANGSTIFSLGANLISGVANNQIAGWEFTDTQLKGGKLILDKTGKIFSEGFQSSPMPLGGTGFMLNIDDGTGASFLEVENARIRGTLSTAVFEKETVNAVGGQLIVANSTVLTSSDAHTSSLYTPTENTLSVVNVTGFSEGEILFAKKVGNTGFNTEYLLVESMSRNSSSNENDFTGNIYVQRGYTGTGTANTSSLPGAVGAATSYSGSQVLVSTGKVGTGFVHINANPNDQATPYIDIVERTGSNLFDARKVARLGDLSGIEDNAFSDGVTGYGLYTTNGYFRGKLELGSIPSPPPVDNLYHHYKLDGFSGSVLANGTGVSNAAYKNNGLGGNTSPITASIDTQRFSDGSTIRYTDGVNGTGVYIERPDNIKFSANSASFGADVTQSGTLVWWQRVHQFSTNSFGGGFGWEADNYDSCIDVQPTRFSIQDVAGGSYHLDYPETHSRSNADEWHHYALAFSLTGITSYKNGIKGEYNAWKNIGQATPGSASINIDRFGWGYFQNTPPYSTASFDDVRIYNIELTENQVAALYNGIEGGGAGGTIIEGGRLKTGVIESNNWGSSVGSQFNLNDGTFKLGGETNPKLEFTGTDLIVSGTVTASGGLIGGINLQSTKMYVGTGTHGNANTQFYVDNTGNFSLEDKLTWDGSDLAITGDITVANPGDFADTDATTNADLYESFLSTLDNTKWITGSLSQTTVATTVGTTNYSGSKFFNTTTDNHTAGFVSSQSFQRKNTPVLEVDFVVNDQYSATSIGFVEDTFSVSDLTAASHNTHLKEGIYLNGTHISVYSDTDNNNHAESITWKNNAWTDGTDTFFRLKITVQPAGGAQYELYKNGDFTQPYATYRTTGNTKAKMKVFVGVHRNESTNAARFLILGELGVNSSIQGTRISGNSISTGLIQSSNYGSGAGSEFNLNDGTFKLGGSSAPKLSWNGSTLAVTGQITIEAGSTTAVDFGAGAAASASAAQSTANTATASAAAAQSTANNASSSLAPYTTQIVLDSTGMELRKVNGKKVAKYGTTTNFYDGSDSENIKLVVQAAGITAYGNNANTYAQVTSAGLDIVENSTNVANFGSTMRVGEDSATKSALRVDSSGNLTIGPQNSASISMSAATGDVNMTGLVSAVNFSEKYVVVNSANLSQYRVAVTGGYNLLCDGSGGGEITMNIQLDADPGKIMDIIIPNAAASQSAEVKIIVNAAGCSYDDGNISTGYKSLISAAAF